MKFNWCTLGLLFLLGGCADDSGGEKMTFTTLQDIPTSRLEELSENTYFFGHQSVGRNMLDGLRMVMQDYPALKLQIIEGDTGESAGPGHFVHANIGENGTPQGKMEHFSSAMDAGLGNQAKAAFLKFCYVDLTEADDPDVLFRQYQQSINTLKARYPDTTFVHFTLPLRFVPSNFKVTIKNLIGKKVPQQQDNIKRNRYNQLMRGAYAGKEPLFDVALLESVDPNTGQSYTFSYGGEHYQALFRGNTYDGGHLNDQGKRWIAEQLVVFLAGLDQGDKQ